MRVADELKKVWRLGTAPARLLPSFVIAGAPKCGTSTLYDYLGGHPGVRRGERKEPTNFLHYPGSRLRSAMNYPLRLGAGGSVVGDASVEYFSHPDGPANVRAIVPDAKIVFLLRDPVRRAWSDYWMFRNFGTESGDFDEIVGRAVDWLSDDHLDPLIDCVERVNSNPVRYVAIGRYARILERWLRVWPREQCLFVLSEDFFARPSETLLDVQRHLGLEARDLPDVPVARDGKIAEVMRPETEKRLRAFYAPENAKLAELLGRGLPWA